MPEVKVEWERYVQTRGSPGQQASSKRTEKNMSRVEQILSDTLIKKEKPLDSAAEI